MQVLVHGPDKILVPPGGAKDLEYQLVGRINVNKILHDNPTKRVVYCYNLAFYFDGDIFHTLRMLRLIVGGMCDGDVHFWQNFVFWHVAISNLM